MRCLITGVAGFLGSHLAERLLCDGHEVTGVDAFTDFYPRSLKEANLACISDHPMFQLIEGKLQELDLLPHLERTDWVYHLAAQAGVRSSWGSEFRTYAEHNIMATQLLLEQCKKVPISKFIYASSSSVYGASRQVPFREDQPLAPLSPYGVTKLAAEQLCMLYWHSYGLPVTVLRYFTVYGPRQRPDMAIQRFFLALLHDSPITVYGDGEQTRDFTFVDDVIEATVSAAQTQSVGEVFNVGGGSSITLNRLLELLTQVTGIKPNVIRAEPARGDMRQTWADISKSQQMLGYRLRVELPCGLKRQYKWLREVWPMPVDKELLDILACPKCKGNIIEDRERDGLICPACRVMYPIRDDIPIMLIEEAIPLDKLQEGTEGKEKG